MPNGGLIRAQASSMEQLTDQLQSSGAAANCDDQANFIYTTLPRHSTKNVVDEIYEEPRSECYMCDELKRSIEATPNFPLALPLQTPRSYSVAKSPLGGLGLFATRAIKAGEVVFVERPIIVNPSIMSIPLSKSLSLPERYSATAAARQAVLEKLLARVVPQRQEAYRGLFNCSVHDESGPLYGIQRTNGFGLGLLQGSNDYTGVFEIGSRFNHSCSPNVHHTFIITCFAMFFTALRNIHEGEELTVSYMSPLTMAAGERRQALKAYDFVCKCPSCLDVTASDARREKIVDVAIVRDTEAFSQWLCDENLSDDYLLVPLLERIALIETEGLHAAAVPYLRAILVMFVAQGDHDNAAKYGKRLGDLLISLTGGTFLCDWTKLGNIEHLLNQELWNIRSRQLSPRQLSAGKFWMGVEELHPEDPAFAIFFPKAKLVKGRSRWQWCIIS